MKHKNQLSKRILALFLWAILIFPSLLNIIHHCDMHIHLECNEQKEHFHQYEIDCEICDFNLLNFNYDLKKCHSLEQSEIFTASDSFYSSLQFHSFLNQSIQLRAPPVRC